MNKLEVKVNIAPIVQEIVHGFMEDYIQIYMHKYSLVYAKGASIDFNMDRLIKAAEEHCSDEKLDDAYDKGYQAAKEEWYDIGWDAAKEDNDN